MVRLAGAAPALGYGEVRSAPVGGLVRRRVAKFESQLELDQYGCCIGKNILDVKGSRSCRCSFYLN